MTVVEEGDYSVDWAQLPLKESVFKGITDEEQMGHGEVKKGKPKRDWGAVGIENKEGVNGEYWEWFGRWVGGMDILRHGSLESFWADSAGVGVIFRDTA